jgi:hypothetical protein
VIKYSSDKFCNAESAFLSESFHPFKIGETSSPIAFVVKLKVKAVV